MPSQNTIDRVALELSRALQPLKGMGASLDDFTNFLNNELGWSASDIPAPITALLADAGALVAIIQSIGDGDEIDTGTLIQITEALVKLAIDIKNIATGSTAGILPALLAEQFLQKLPIELLDYLLVDYLQTYHPLGYTSMKLLGMISTTQVNAITPARPPHLERTVNWANFGKVFTNPADVFADIYKWGSPDFDLLSFQNNVGEFFNALNIPTYLVKLDPGTAMVIEEKSSPEPDQIKYYLKMPFADPHTDGISANFGIGLFPLPQNGSLLPGFAILPYGNANTTTEITITDKLHILIKTGFDITGGVGIIVRPGSAKIVTGFGGGGGGIGEIDGSISVGLLFGSDGSGPPTKLITFSDDSYLQIQNASVNIGASLSTNSADNDVFVEFDLNGGQLAIGASGNDGFLSKLLGDGGIKADFALTVGISTKRGVYFKGSGGLEIQLPAHIDLGPISIEGLTISVTFKDGTIPISAGADIKGTLGPLVAVVQNIGITATVSFPGQGGNLGPVNLGVGFKPPNGVGLSLDAGIIKGGGFLYLDFDKGEYYGALELEFQDLFSLKAIGIINTKMPDGSSGFSLLIIITADFTPIQLGFGFTLNGVGGLLGLNRTMEVDVLREGVKTNAIKSVLFPEDVVANISRIISDLKAIFPPFEGHFIVGPMAELGWASIITLEIGILIEIPDPKIAILGVIKALMPDEDVPLLRIQINFLGVIDFDNKYISFDASLYDSNILVFTLTGDMAFRLSWGDHPFFLLSVGGFHPAYKEAPPDLQHMVRLGISLLSNDYLKVSVTCYFAVTSNTVQFGAKVELYAGVSEFNVYGYLGFDVLFQFDPFHFIADIYAGLALRSGTSTIMGISLSGELSGPKPWNVKGEASFSILFFTISVHVDTTWGDSGDAGSQKKIDVLALLTAAIADDSNWRADIPTNSSQHVSIKQIPAGAGELIIHPFGILTFSERIVPLDIDITKFGNDLPQDANHFQIVNSDPGVTTSVAQEPFSPANFFTLTDAEKLSRNSFEPMDSGFRLTGSSNLQTADVETEDVTYRITYLRKKKNKLVRAGLYQYAQSHFQSNLAAGSVSKSTLSFASNRASVNAPDTVTVADPQYAIANTSDLKLHDPSLLTGSYTQAVDKYNALLTSQPALKGKLQIVSAHELNAN